MALYKHSLEKDELWLKTTLKCIGDAVIAADDKGVIKFLNPTAELLTGWSVKDALNKNLDQIFKIYYNDDFASSRISISKILNTSHIFGYTDKLLLLKKNGSSIPITLTISPIQFGTYSSSGIVLIFQDITKELEYEQTLKKATFKLSALLSAMKDNVFVIDNNGRYLQILDTNSKLISGSPETFIGKTFHEIYEQERADKFLKSVKKSLLSNKTINIEYDIFINDKTFWFMASISPLKTDTVIWVARDITEHKLSEATSLEKEQNYKTLIELSAAPVFVLYKKRLVLVNAAWEKLFGYTAEEATSENFDVMNIVAPKDHKMIQEHFAQKIVKKDKPSRYEMRGISKDGKTFTLEVNVSVIKWKGELAYQGIYHNITKQKLQEEQLTHAKEDAERVDRLKTEFLAQMSHEIRTPLNNIITFSSLLREEFEKILPEGLESSFKVIDTSARRLIRTIELILNMSRIQTGNFETNFELIDLNEDILDDLVLEFYSRAKEKGINLQYEMNTDKSNIMGDKYLLGQILINLIDNAIKYTPSGIITLRLYYRNKKICVDIEDTGIGISAEYLPQIFSPFSQEDIGYTRHFEGTGLGLAVVKEYVELSRGTIEVQSKKGKGTKFTLFFTPAETSTE